MEYYKLILAYDGTSYYGWQKQKDEKRTISGVLTKVFKNVFKQNIAIVGASRTDAHVHALGQVARIKTTLCLDASKMMHAWNNSLPQDIFIRSLETVTDNFHPLKNVEEKIYWYHFFLARTLPFFQRYGYCLKYPTDIEKLQECLNIFVGKHNFRSFATGDEMGENTTRIINNIKMEHIKEIDAYRIIVRGPSFMRYMIRRIIGASLEVASRKYMPIEYLQDALDQLNPLQPLLPTAPAHGLLLHSIKYY